MTKQDQIWLWLSAALSMVMGSILVLNGTGAGWFLIILGFTFLGASTKAGQKWVDSRLNLARWGLIGIMVFTIFLVAVAVALILT
jgi:hypothetical protein